MTRYSGRTSRFDGSLTGLEVEGPNMLSKMAEELRSDPLMAIVSPNYDGREGEGVEPVSDNCAGRYDGTGGIAGF